MLACGSCLPGCAGRMCCVPDWYGPAISGYAILYSDAYIKIFFWRLYICCVCCLFVNKRKMHSLLKCVEAIETVLASGRRQHQHLQNCASIANIHVCETSAELGITI